VAVNYRVRGDYSGMTKRFGIVFLLFCFFYMFPACQLPAEENPPIKLAIVDVGTAEKVSGPFMDLLLVSFNKYPEIALLERTEIDKLLKEQALSLSSSGEDMVKAGKLWTTDAFLMLESSTSGNDNLLRLRLVNTQYGLKLWDTFLFLPASAEEYEQQAEKLAEMTVRKIDNIKVSHENLVMLGVSNFRTEEVSSRWEWLSEILATGIEQNLGLYPGIILMERTKTRSLTEERELVQGLPEALRASTVFIDGAYRMEREKGPDIVSVYIRCRKQEVTLLETRIEGSVNNFAGLYQKICKAVIKNIVPKIDKKPMGPKVEAEMLINEVMFLLSKGNLKEALSLSEASLSLVPDSVEYHQLLLRVIIRILYAEKSNNKPEDYMRLNLRALQASEFIVLNRPLDISTKSSIYFYNVNNYFLLFNHFSLHRIIYSSGAKELSQEYYKNFWRLYYLCKESYKGKNNLLYRYLLSSANYAFAFCDNINHAIQFSQELISESVELSKIYPPGCDEYSISGFGLFHSWVGDWTEEKDAKERVTEYLEKLVQSEELLIRFNAVRAAVRFYSNIIADNKKAIEHCRKFIAMIKKDISVQLPQWNIANLSYMTIVNARFTKEESLAIQSDLFLDLMLFCAHKNILHRCDTSGKQYDWSLHKSCINNYLRSIKNLKIKGIFTNLEKAIGAIPVDTPSDLK
jgi:hypothetical protein